MDDEIARLKAENNELRVKLGQALMDLDWYKRIELKRIKQSYEDRIRELGGDLPPTEEESASSE